MSVLTLYSWSVYYILFIVKLPAFEVNYIPMNLAYNRLNRSGIASYSLWILFTMTCDGILIRCNLYSKRYQEVPVTPSGGERTVLHSMETEKVFTMAR